MKKKNLERWKKYSEMGLIKFIFIHGVVFWGCTTALLLTSYQYFRYGTPFISNFIVKLEIRQSLLGRI